MSIGKNQDSELIVRAIIDLAHNLRLNVVAEGVETTQHLDYLTEKGCDDVQGYLFSRPMDSVALNDLLGIAPAE